MKGLAKLMGNPAIATLVIFLSCLAIFAGFLWQNQHISQQHQQAIEQKQRYIVGIIHSAVEDKIVAYSAQVAAAAKSPHLATLIKREDPRLIASQERALKRVFPQAEQACLINASVDEPDEDGCIPITSASLNSLRLAKKEGSAPIAVMQTGKEDAYLLLTRSTEDKQKRVVGISAIALSTDILQTLFQPSYSVEDYIKLQQGSNTVTVLASQGDRKWRQGQPLLNRAVANSHWRIAYWPVKTKASQSYLVAIGIVLPLFC